MKERVLFVRQIKRSYTRGDSQADVAQRDIPEQATSIERPINALENYKEMEREGGPRDRMESA
ncbi:MAG: hypothetical protein NPIRA05_20240 [Nitrospirales bacterium]|nr:MAG: hypothetical protein NPIRA05_20240 [Nitrospirales bacterium]